MTTIGVHLFCSKIPDKEKKSDFEKSDFEIGKKYLCIKHVKDNGILDRLEVCIIKHPSNIKHSFKMECNIKCFASEIESKLLLVKERLTLNKNI